MGTGTVGYYERLTDGLCTVCGKRKPAAGAQTCATCRVGVNRRNQARKNRLIAAGLCKHCRQPCAKGRQQCEGCLQAQRKRRACRKAAVCFRCGKGPLATQTYCGPCLALNKKRRGDRVAKWKAEGVCHDCGRPQKKGSKRCTDCSARLARNAATRLTRFAQSGLCVNCGKCPPLASLPAHTSLLQRVCLTCYMKRAAHRGLKNSKAWETLLQQLDRQQWRCAYTGESIVLGVNDSIDHVLPVCRFPESQRDPANIEWVVRQINSLKGGYTRDEFLALVRVLAARNPGPVDTEMAFSVPLNWVGRPIGPMASPIPRPRKKGSFV